MNDSNSANGTCLSLEGRLLVAEEVPARICSYVIGASGQEDRKVLATPAKKPNDLCQLANGRIYFTCPDWSTTPANQGVYLLEPNGVVTLVKNGLYQPNGVKALKWVKGLKCVDIQGQLGYTGIWKSPTPQVWMLVGRFFPPAVSLLHREGMI
jgi:sugar lactone lactonase YvrE